MNITQLSKAYKKRFDRLNKLVLKSSTVGFDYFIEHLKYQRDLLIISAEEENLKENIKLATIIAIIAEYEASKTSENKELHWNTFCELLKQNMED